MVNRLPSHYHDIGILGEELVAQFLQATGWVVLHRRWSCHWGEVDIIARQEVGVNSHLPLLAFVEVKTRSPRNWDLWGMLSITHSKKTKLCQTAKCFLAAYPHLIDYACRFDVALVRCQTLPKQPDQDVIETPLTLELSIDSSPSEVQKEAKAIAAGYQLTLHEYIASAFD